MLVEKVASSPELAVLEGWTAEDTSLSEDEVAALHLALGMGMSASAHATVEQLERHTVADLTSSALPTTGPTLHSIDTKSSFVRLQPVIEAQENSSLTSAESEPEQLSSKVASFYIGGDDGLPHGDGRLLSLRLSVSTPRQVKADLEGKARTVSFIPPDGGYGWVIALSACFINIWIVGFMKSYGVLYVEIRNAYPDASAYHTSWLPSLLSTVGLLIAPATGFLCRRFTSRKVSFLGGFLCFLGLLLGSLAASMNQLILSVGLLTGLGAGLTTTPGVLIVSLYFEKRRAFASAICVSGNALGGFLLPPLVDHLLSSYGLRGTWLILAGLQLHICAASMLYRPISHHALLQATRRQNEGDMDGVLKDKLLPSTPASQRPQPEENPTESEVHLTRSKALWRKFERRFNATKDDEETELRHQVSFLRTASMMNSIPDLTRYARSWSVSGDPSYPLVSSASVSAGMTEGSKSSLLDLVSSKLNMLKQPLFAEHPSVLRLFSEEEGVGTPTSGSVRRGSVRKQSRTTPGQDNRIISRQSSVRVAQSRIMEPVKESDEPFPKKCASVTVISASDGRKESIAVVKYKLKDNEKASDYHRGCCFCCLTCVRQCDSSLLHDGLFWVIAVSVFLMACGAPFSLFYLPAYAESVHISTSHIPSILSISSILDLIGRLGTGLVSDLGIFQLHHIYIASSLAAGVAVLLVPTVTTFPGLTAVLSLYGVGVGSWFVMIPAILASHHGAAHLSSSYGLVRLCNGVMNFISPQITGVLFDVTESYLVIYLLMGCSMVVGSVMVVMMVPIVHHCRHIKPYAVTHPSHPDHQSAC